ncbi:unnamed protein product [Ceutorhynchus assimilis]|uniref:NADH dehydrogenase [ubiquinone] 1 alpha subcomplex subunit 12 n=1 Tax=Ceutorhynchus assimilis TaxID=467358 RepID=A0A9N9MHH2_9CUCU|nr:unnamed protein product [Ceutorhynchus assimilis]
MSIVKLFNLNCVPNFMKTVKFHGGYIASLYKLFVMDSLKPGTCMGIDEYGNKYYENKGFFVGRSRWVEYARNVFLDYDGSQVPASWFGWLHYKTDYIPECDPGRPSPNYKWMLEHTENFTGTPGQYMPYSTTMPKIHAWVPPCEKDDKCNP